MPDCAVLVDEERSRDHLEFLRLAALADLHTPDAGPDDTLDRIVNLAKASLDFPFGYVSLIDAKHQIFKTATSVPLGDGSRQTAFCSRTILTNRPLIVVDTLQDPEFSEFPQVKGPPFVRAYWGCPLTTRTGFNVGAFCMLDVKPRSPSESQLSHLADFGRLTVEFMELRAQALTDSLTSVSSRRAFFTEGERIFMARRPARTPLSCIVLDVDHFKGLNDKFGHAVGDTVLRRLGGLLVSLLRPDSLIGRIGGEEFAILLPGEDLKGAADAAERIRGSLVGARETGTPAFTASFGVAERSPSDRTFKELINRADQAAYAAKSAGRNCVREAGLAA